jgi:hypothetical protein
MKGGKDRGEENSDNKEEASLAKADDKTKGKKKKGNKDKKKETQTCNHCHKKGHIETNCWEKDPSQMPKQFQERKDAKTEKATAAVEEEHILSIVDMEVEDEVEYEFHNDAAVGVACLDMNDAFINIQVMEDNAFVQIELGLENEDEPNDVSQIRPTLQTLSSPNMWIEDTGATMHSTKQMQGGINSQPSMSRTRGIFGQAGKPDAEVDIPGIYCDKIGTSSSQLSCEALTSYQRVTTISSVSHG